MHERVVYTERATNSHSAKNKNKIAAKTISCMTLLRKKGFDPTIIYTENGY